MNRGDVRWYKFQHPDKKRPVVILTRDSALVYMSEVTIVPITSTVRDIPVEVLLDFSDGLSKECAANCDHLQTVAKHKLGALITRLSLDKIDEIEASIAFALGFVE